MKHNIKRIMFVFLKWIKHLFQFIGIEVSLRKKGIDINPFQINSLATTNQSYSSKDYQRIVFSKEQQVFFHFIIQQIKKSNINLDNKIIADFGCGVGNLLFHINSQFNPSMLYGFDFSEQALKLAKERVGSAEFQVNDIYEKIDNNFDIIFCTETLEHLLYPDKVLSNFISMTNSPGIIFLTVPDGRKDNFGGHINFWSPESWKVFIEVFSPTLKFETGYIRDDILYAIIYKD